MPKTLMPKCQALAEEWRLASERELSTANDIRAIGRDWPNVYWHAGLALELALKAIRIKKDGLEEWPQSDKGRRWHNIESIAREAGILSDVKAHSRRDSAFAAYWLTGRDWEHGKRYPPNSPTENEARELLMAVANPTSGVMKWLSQIYLNI